MMKTDNMYAPHGGSGLVNRIVPEAERSALKKSCVNKTYQISDADLSVFYRIADGVLSPLTGPMNSDEFNQVLEDEVIIRDRKKYAWTIPLAFPVSDADAKTYQVGETIAVEDTQGRFIGTLIIEDIYPFNKEKYNRSVYGTEREDHPGARIFNNDPREVLLGGKIWALPQPNDPNFGKYLLSPLEVRTMIQSRGWERTVAFQTRNALHRAHEYALIFAVESLTRNGYHTGAVLNPLVGATKSDDVPADVRMRTYEAMLQNRVFGEGDLDLALWESKNHHFEDNLVLVGMDMKMFYAGPKEAIMHAIYRQNYGFTNIVIGRKHADAPYDDGTAIWGDFDAHEKFDNLNGELLIQPSKVGFAAFFEEINRVGLIEEFKPKGYHTVFISGKDVRNKLASGEGVDERIMRKCVGEILTGFYRNK